MPTVAKTFRRTPLFLAILVPSFLIPASLTAAELQWTSGEHFRSAMLSVPSEGKIGFSSIPAGQTGIDFTNRLTLEMCGRNQNLMGGAGVAIGDIDADGLPDIFFCNLMDRNALYRNLGNFRFEDVTDRAGVACEGMYSVGATFADLNGDGHLDLYVTSNEGPNAYFVNDGTGRFTDMTSEAGLALRGLGCTTPAIADVDGDGDIDLWVGSYGENTVLRSGASVSYTTDRSGRTQIRGRHRRRLYLEGGMLMERGETNILFLNNGNNTFSVANWTDGTFRDADGAALDSAPLEMTLTTMFRDIDQDGDPDIYECNDFQGLDRVWINDGTGKFQELDPLSLRSGSVFSMGVAFSDLNHDGYDDFLVCDMLSQSHQFRMTQKGQTNPLPSRPGIIRDQPQIRRNTVFINRGDGTYAEIANYANLHASDWTWNPLFLDVDLDGWDDVLISNGHAYDTQDHDASEKVSSLGNISMTVAFRNLQYYPVLRTPNMAFRNQRDLTFDENGAGWGFNSERVTHGIAQADLDLDGDLDIVGNCLNDPPLIYRNDAIAPRVAVRLRGNPPNVQAIGARVRLINGAVPSQHREIQGGGHYLSGAGTELAFATGSSQSMKVEVTWRSGKKSYVENVLPNHVYEISETGAVDPVTPATQPKPVPLFTDVSDRIAHSHTEEYYDDFARQPLLYKKLSQPGPGMAWTDLDQDSDDDLVIGDGLGGELAVYRNAGKGQFERWDDPIWANPNLRDQVGISALPTATGTDLIVGWSNYEDGMEVGPGGQIIRFTGGQATLLQDIPATLSSTGPTAIGDLDGKGGFILFVGGRTVPGKFPEPASSRVYRRVGDKWTEDATLSSAFDKVGLVRAALFSDVSNDHRPELILATEWGPIRVFEMAGDRVTERTESLGLMNETGWWTSVTTGDFNGDGLMDIVGGNIGLNSLYRASPEDPVMVYFGDFDGFGSIEILEAYREETLDKIVPRLNRQELDQAMPFLRLKYARHKQFATTSVQDMLGPIYDDTRKLEASQLASVVFLNRGNRFEPVQLPMEAQWSAVFGMNVADFDGNGTEDLFLAQNFFAISTTVPRLDAGRGLLLLGDGQGGFVPQKSQASGIYVYGESRGSAAGDFDHDGRTDLAVSQNGTETKLYQNTGGKPGLRIRLVGEENNPAAIGARIRLIAAGTPGPVREIRTSSGYLSQDSLVQVMTRTGDPDQIEVRWPGGETRKYPISKSNRTVTIDYNGGVTANP